MSLHITNSNPASERPERPDIVRASGESVENVVDVPRQDNRARIANTLSVQDGGEVSGIETPEQRYDDTRPTLFAVPREKASEEQKETRRENTKRALDILAKRSDRLVVQLEKLRRERKNAKNGEPAHYIYQDALQFGGGPHGIASALGAEKKFGARGARLIVHGGKDLSPVFSSKEDTNFFANETLEKINPDVDPFRGVLDMTSTALGGNDMPNTGHVGELILRAAVLLQSPIMHQARVEGVEVRDSEDTAETGWDVDALFRARITYARPGGGQDSVFIYTDEITDATGLGETRIPVPLDEVLVDDVPVKIDAAATSALRALEAALPGVVVPMDRNRIVGWLRWRAKRGVSVTAEDLIARVRKVTALDDSAAVAIREQFHPTEVQENSTYHVRQMITEEMKHEVATGVELPGIMKATKFIPGMTDRKERREMEGDGVPEVLGKKPGRIAIIGSGYTALVCAHQLSDAFIAQKIEGQQVSWLGPVIDEKTAVDVRKKGVVNMSPLGDGRPGGVLTKRIEKMSVVEDGVSKTVYRVSFVETELVDGKMREKAGAPLESQIFDHLVIAAGFENTVLDKFGAQADQLEFDKVKMRDARLKKPIAVAQELRSVGGKAVPPGAYRVVGPAANGIPKENRTDPTDTSALSVPADLEKTRERIAEFAYRFFEDLERSPTRSQLQRLVDALTEKHQPMQIFYLIVKAANTPREAYEAVAQWGRDRTPPESLLDNLLKLRGEDPDVDAVLKGLESPYNNTSPDSLDQMLHRTLDASEDDASQNERDTRRQQILDGEVAHADFLRQPLTGTDTDDVDGSRDAETWEIDVPNRGQEKKHLAILQGKNAPHWREVAVGFKMRLTNAVRSLRVINASNGEPPKPAMLRCERRDGKIRVIADAALAGRLRATLESDRDLLSYCDAMLESYGNALNVSVGFTSDGFVDATSIQILSPISYLNREFDALNDIQRRSQNILRGFIHRLNPMRFPNRLLEKIHRTTGQIIPPENTPEVKQRIIDFYRRNRPEDTRSLTVDDAKTKESGASYFLLRDAKTDQVVASFTVYENGKHFVPLNYLHNQWKLERAGLSPNVTGPMDAVVIRHKDGDEHIAILAGAAKGEELGTENAPVNQESVASVGILLAQINGVDARKLRTSGKRDMRELRERVKSTDAKLRELIASGLLSQDDARKLLEHVSFTHGDPRMGNCFVRSSGSIIMTGYYNGGLGARGEDYLAFVDHLRSATLPSGEDREMLMRAFTRAYFSALT